MVVVGAGFAGLVAARELRRLGIETTVLEARERVGGRAWTSTGLGLRLEMELPDWQRPDGAPVRRPP